MSLFSSRIILNTLGVEDFGIYNVVGGIVVMFLFLNGALSASTSRFITIELGKGDYENLQKIFSTTLVNHLILAVLILVLGETVGLWFLLNKLVIPESRMGAALWVYQISIITAIISLLQTPYNAIIIAHEKMNVYSWVSIADALLKLSTLYILVIFNVDKLKLYACLVCLVTIIMSIFYYYYVKRSFHYCKFKYNDDKNMYKNLAAYSGWDLIGNMSIIAQGQGLNMLLNIFFGAVVNAARGISYQVQGAITQFSGNFMTVVRPQIIKYYTQGEKEKMIDLISSSAKYSFF